MAKASCDIKITGSTKEIGIKISAMDKATKDFKMGTYTADNLFKVEWESQVLGKACGTGKYKWING